MNTHQKINNRQLTKCHNIMKLSVIALTIALTTACADRSIVAMEPQVEQQKDLRDLDSDGVIEAREKCADTILGATIDNYGCGKSRPLSESVNLGIQFANDSSLIPRREYAKIKEVADFLNNHSDNQVTIEGHTSKVGTLEYNQVLSEQRASAVASVLINEFKISGDRISTVGYSFNRLIDEGTSPAAHAVNRRILAELSSSGTVDAMIWTIYTVDKLE